MLGKKGILVFFGVMFVLAGFLPLITEVEAGEGVLAPPIISGTISSDTTWSTDVILDNVLIDNGVTVRVDPGVTLYMAPLSDLYIQGTMICKGTVTDPIDVRCSATTDGWDKIQVNATGTLYFENFTLDEGSNGQTWLVQASGACFLKHGLINGGYQGYWATGPGDLSMEDMTFKNCQAFGMVIATYSGETSIKDLEIDNCTGGIAAAYSVPLDISNIDISNITGYEAFHIEGSTDVVFRDFNVRSDDMGDYGIGCYNSNNTVKFVDGEINDVNTGIKARFGGDNILDFENVHFRENVNNTYVADPGASFQSTFTNCSLDAESDLFDLNGTGGIINVDLINTSYDRTARWNLVGENTWVNLSYYMDLDITNDAGDPLDSRFSFKRTEEPAYTEIDSPDGHFERMLFPDRMVQGDNLPKIVTHTMIFMARSDPSAIKTISDYNINRYQYRWMKLNLAPINDYPETLNIDEDTWLDIDLKENFTDPDGLPLTFDAESSDSLILESMGNQTSGLFRVKNFEDDWSGVGWIVFKCVDSGGRRTEVNTTVNVIPVNDPPVLNEPIPELETEEDIPVFFNFTGIIMDVEGSPVTLEFPENVNYTADYIVSTMNLTIIPAENFFGILQVEVDISDGVNVIHENIVVNVTPVNDLPEVSVMANGISAEMVPFQWNETTEIMVYNLTLEEDASLPFRIEAIDVDSVDLTYYFDEDDLQNGSIVVEANQIEVIINETTNETELRDVIIPMNFTYTPFADDHKGDLVRFFVDDGEDRTEVWIMFNVVSVNDPIVFTYSDDWNITVEPGVPENVDIGEMISDKDGDTPVITTSSSHVTVNGTNLNFAYDDTFDADMEVVEITVTDGLSSVTASLTVNIDRSGISDEPTLGEPEVSVAEDSWTVEVEGSEGQDLWVVVEDEDGKVASYQMEYGNGVYSVNIKKDDAEEGLSYWISDAEDGDSLDDPGILPALKDSESDDPFPIGLIILIVVVILLLIIVLVVVLLRRGSNDYPDEE